MSPLSTNANPYRLLILPSGERSRAGMMYHNLFARRSEFGVADSRFGRCFPMASLHMPSTWTLMRACAPANRGCTFPPVSKRSCRSSNETASRGGASLRLFWSTPFQSPRRSTSPAAPPLMRAASLRRPGSAWTAASNTSRLGCWDLQLTAGQLSGAGAPPLARASTTQRAWSTWRPCPHGKRTARCPSWSVK